MLVKLISTLWLTSCAMANPGPGFNSSVKLCAAHDNRGRTYDTVCHNDPGSCFLENTTLTICCSCFDVCCDLDIDHSNLTLARIERQAIDVKSNRSAVSVVRSSLSDVSRGVSGALGGTLDTVSVRVRRQVSKTSRGTGEDADATEDDNSNNSSWASRKELEAVIGTAGKLAQVQKKQEIFLELFQVVRIALNKLANTLKNVTDEEPSSNENMTSTTVAPPSESCSSKSKRCDEQEPDLLDEFFPPKGSRGKGRRRRSEDSRYDFKSVDGKKSKDFGSSGGLISKGEIISWANITDIGASMNSSSHGDHTEGGTTTEEPAGNDTTVNVTRTKQGNRRVNVSRNKMSHDTQMSSPRPTLVASSLLVPNIKPGKCEDVTANNQSCIAIQPDAAQCTTDSECESTWKCCFYGCKPYQKVGICSVPVYY